MFILYNLVLVILSPIWVPWMVWRSKKRREAPNWQERGGNYFAAVPAKQKGKRRIWVHAVSVGEVIAARPFLKEFRALAPDCEIVLSVTTSSGHQTARENLEMLVDSIVYLPIDVPKFTLRAMQRVQPDALVIMETELWMNLLWAAKVFDAKVLVVNGRISDRAYKSDTKVKFYFRALFRDVDRVLVQSPLDKERYESLGAKNVEVFGNTKFDEAAATPVMSPQEWRDQLGIPDGRQVVVVGSTRSEMEEELVVNSFFKLDNVVFIHAPRHIESAERIAGIFAKHVGATGRTVGFRSKRQKADYIILDTFGELGSVYSVADVVVIGGGFDNLGGQNLIQPMAAGKPALHGPNMMNFRTVSEASVKAGASIVCPDEASLVAALTELLADPAKQQTMGEAGAALVAQNVGASKRYADAVLAALPKR